MILNVLSQYPQCVVTYKKNNELQTCMMSLKCFVVIIYLRLVELRALVLSLVLRHRHSKVCIRYINTMLKYCQFGVPLVNHSDTTRHVCAGKH